MSFMSATLCVLRYGLLFAGTIDVILCNYLVAEQNHWSSRDDLDSLCPCQELAGS